MQLSQLGRHDDLRYVGSIPVPSQAQASSPAFCSSSCSTPLAPDSDPRAQVGYVLTNNAGAKLAIHVLAFTNTVTWQFSL